MMKRKILFLIILFATYTSLADRIYPESVADRKWEDVGSFSGEEGIVFRPGKVKNESTKAIGCPINRYLWQATIEVLGFMSLASTDSNGGVIITDWYTPPDAKDYRFKINVLIKDDVINPDAIEVKIFEEIWKNQKWVAKDSSQPLALSLEDRILRKARALYINSERKKTK